MPQLNLWFKLKGLVGGGGHVDIRPVPCIDALLNSHGSTKYIHGQEYTQCDPKNF